VYDALLGDRFFLSLREVFEWLVRRYQIQFASAADAACGTGTFVRYLRAGGVPTVYGVDRSPEMLRAALAKNRGNGARFLRQDLTMLRLPQPVDLVTCFFDSLNYLVETTALLGALRRVHANLRAGGHTIFDMITDRLRSQGLGVRRERASGAGFALERLTRWDPQYHVQTARIAISLHGREYRETHVQRGYGVGAVTELLEVAGFLVRGVHDFQSLGAPARWTSRAIYVARRA
jgi:SAM-dependent methyltransferase